MNDPWDVKCVRHSWQYVSCMKINGMPLLPPVLSKECRKEMQHYKLLAREVEKKLSILKSIVGSDSDSSEDKTYAPELPENEECYELPQEEIRAGFDVNIEKITAIPKDSYENSFMSSPKSQVTDYYTNLTTVTNAPTTSALTGSSKLVFDLNLSINETGRNLLDSVKNSHSTLNAVDLPERDYNCSKPLSQRKVNSDVESPHKNKKQNGFDNAVSLSFSVNKDVLTHPFHDLSANSDGPSSLGSKSFTGSLIDIHTESHKESQKAPKLIRQRSYTLLKPGPQLQAHLEIQSLSTGVDVNCISMSESLSNLSYPHKKRRSWDLESAKEKWSSMALELNQKTIKVVPKVNGAYKNGVSKLTPKKSSQPALQKAKSLSAEKARRPNALINKALPKSEPIQITKTPFNPALPSTSNRTLAKEPITQETSPKTYNNPHKTPVLISESEDPAARVRELYEKIQKQQLIQMANLVDKQKKEQLLLQQVFEEQNNLLYKQLKTICPTSSIEVKKAWGESANDDPERGPVSLSELINNRTPEKCEIESPVSATLTETKNYINHCEDVLKKSKDITCSLKKQQSNVRVASQTRGSPKKIESISRTASPMSRNTSRRLNYDTSASSDREYEPMLTDRTNDTMADINVSFPSDSSEHHHTRSSNKSLVKQVKDVFGVPPQNPAASCKTPAQIVPMSESLQASIDSLIRQPVKPQPRQPTPEERSAASRIVACARGYLVRRLLRTERVRATVQTIRDALVCALQLHQDRAGIRGADVDLHRRLIQQITAACYSLHDTFIASSPAERCAMIAADRGRRRSLAARPPPRPSRATDIMSQSHSGAFPARPRRTPAPGLMTQSNYETFSMEKSVVPARRYPASPHRRPWR